MFILSIDTCSDHCNVSLIENETILKNISFLGKNSHGEHLMVLIKEAFASTNKELDDIDLIAVTTGPGSFTGLRIGTVTAGTLAYAKCKSLVCVSSLDALWENFNENKFLGNVKLDCAKEHNVYLAPMIKSKRGESFLTLIKRTYDKCSNNSYEDVRILEEGSYTYDDISTYFENIKKENVGNKIIAFGDGFSMYESYLQKNKSELLVDLTENRLFDPTEEKRETQIDQINGVNVAFLGLKEYEVGNLVSALDIRVNYLKETSAEVQLREKLSDLNE